jgi:hypothetical protein
MKRLAALVLAALLVTAGVAAAAPGNGNTPADGSSDAADANQSASDGPSANAPDVDRGPSVDLPDAVPQHVQQIHDAVNQFLDGALDGTLGDAVSSVTPDDDTASNDDAANATATQG